MTKSGAEQALYDLQQISMKLPSMFGEDWLKKRTWSVSRDGTVVGYLGRKKDLEFGAGAHFERVAMAWAERLSLDAAEDFAAKYPDLNYRGKQTHVATAQLTSG